MLLSVVVSLSVKEKLMDKSDCSHSCSPSQHPASTTHRQLEKELRERAGAGDDVLRLSIGLETAEDLIRDLDFALGSK